MTIRATTPDETDKIAELMGYAPGRSTRGIVFLAEESACAAVFFDHWTAASAEAHVYAPSLKHLFSPNFLHAIFDYAFNQAQRKMLVTATPANQKGSLAVSGWLGFYEIFRIRDGWDTGVDMVLKELRREDCRFIQQDVKSRAPDA